MVSRFFTMTGMVRPARAEVTTARRLRMVRRVEEGEEDEEGKEGKVG